MARSYLGSDFSLQDAADSKETDTKTTRGVVKASVSSASVTRSKAGWGAVEDDDVDYELPAGSPHTSPPRPSPTSPAQHDDDIVYENYEDDLRGATGSSFEYDQDDGGVRESRTDSIDTVSRLRPSREAFGAAASAKSDLPPLNKGNKSSSQVSAERDWDMVLSPHEDSEAFPDDDLYESVVEEDEEMGEATLNMSHRSNQEEDEEEQRAIKKVFKEATARVVQDESMDSKDSPDDEDEEEEDDYGDDFEDGGDDDADEIPPVAVATKNATRTYDRLSDDEDEGSIESIEELEEDISVGLASSGDEGEDDRGLGRGMTRSSSGMLPQTSSAHSRDRVSDSDDAESGPAMRTKASAMRDFDHNSDDDELGIGPETGSATSEDIEQLDFSVGSGDSESNSFLHEDVGSSRKGTGESAEFSASEHEVSGSHGLDGFDYTTNAIPPPRRGGW